MKAVHYTDCYCESCEDARRQLDAYEVSGQFPCEGSMVNDPPTKAEGLNNRLPADPKPRLPGGAKERKNVPLYSGLVAYFPDALAYVARISDRGSKQHHPGMPIHWDRSKSMDHHDCLLRHLWDAGTVDTDGMLHSGKVAWRALAALQLELEKDTNGR